MPEISRFYGIIIKMFTRGEHNPPHIHAIYAENNALVDINTCKIIEGDLPKRATNMVETWAEKYQYELIDMWNTKQIKKLPPLD